MTSPCPYFVPTMEYAMEALAETQKNDPKTFDGLLQRQAATNGGSYNTVPHMDFGVQGVGSVRVSQ